MTVDLAHWNANALATDHPDFDVARYAAGIRPAASYDLRAKLEQWREDGIVTFESCIPDNFIDELLVDIRELCLKRDQYQLEVEHGGRRYPIGELPIDPLSDSRVKFNCLENISFAATRLSLSAFVCDFLRHVFQDTPVVIQSLTFWRGSEQAAHLDYPWVRVQTRLPQLAASWIPLEDIHPDAGPLAYYPGSHKPGVIPPLDWGHGSLVQEPDSARTPNDFVAYLDEWVDHRGLKSVSFTPKRGDVLIWHGGLLHGGPKANDPSHTRRSYVTHFTSLGSYPAAYRCSDAMNAKRYTELNGGICFDHPWNEGQKRLSSRETA